MSECVNAERQRESDKENGAGLADQHGKPVFCADCYDVDLGMMKVTLVMVASERDRHKTRVERQEEVIFKLAEQVNALTDRLDHIEVHHKQFHPGPCTFGGNDG